MNTEQQVHKSAHLWHQSAPYSPLQGLREDPEAEQSWGTTWRICRVLSRWPWSLSKASSIEEYLTCQQLRSTLESSTWYHLLRLSVSCLVANDCNMSSYPGSNAHVFLLGLMQILARVSCPCLQCFCKGSQTTQFIAISSWIIYSGANRPILCRRSDSGHVGIRPLGFSHTLHHRENTGLYNNGTASQGSLRGGWV